MTKGYSSYVRYGTEATLYFQFNYEMLLWEIIKVDKKTDERKVMLRYNKEHDAFELFKLIYIGEEAYE